MYIPENLDKPYLLIRFLWSICKESSFFQTFTKKGRQNVVAININAYALLYACTRMTIANDVLANFIHVFSLENLGIHIVTCDVTHKTSFEGDFSQKPLKIFF